MKRQIIVLFIVLVSFQISLSQTISAKEKAVYKSQWIEMCSSMNKQCPIVVDELTTLRSMTFYNWTLSTVYNIDLDVNDFSDDDIDVFLTCLKTYQKKNIPRLFSRGKYDFRLSDFPKLLKALNMKFRMLYYDTNQVLLGIIVFDYRDFVVK